ncbi:hypothetical protein CBS101457_003388 [Exobasidium rhododendri]|nr:hypothetical protein CBS101457_003388 [Exobasidium rhododendri]
MRQSATVEDKERVDCLEAIQAVTVEENSLPQELLRRIQSTLTTDVRTKDEAVTIDRGLSSENSVGQSEIKAKFHALVQETTGRSPCWNASPDKEGNVGRVHPEIKNLLHFLVDDYSSWKTKWEATRMVLFARLHDGNVDVDGEYERFYSEMFLGSACACAATAATPATMGGDEDYSTVWRSALCGLMPSLVEKLEMERTLDLKDGRPSTRQCMAKVVRSLFSEGAHALSDCEVILTSKEERRGGKKGTTSTLDEKSDMMLDVFVGTNDEPARQPIRAAFLRSLEERNLLHREDWRHESGMESIIVEDWQLLSDTFLTEMSRGSMADLSSTSISPGLEVYFETKFNAEVMEDLEWWARTIDDYASQEALAHAVLKFTLDCISANDLENVSKLCKSLMMDVIILDILLLYICPSQLLQPIASLLDDQDLFSNGEEPSVIGGMLLFAQLLIQMGLERNYNLECLLPSDHFHFLPSFVRSSTSSHVLSTLEAKEQDIISKWVIALFGSEGISDELIKGSSPQVLLRITPTIFSQSINACMHGVIDLDTLRGGLTYFLQDLLNYTLPSALTWLLSDLHHLLEKERSSSPVYAAANKASGAKSRSIHLEVLSTLLSSDTCPRIVKDLVANRASQVLRQCDDADFNVEVKLLQSAVELGSRSQQIHKTHLWMKADVGTMTMCSVDSLLNLDTSLTAINLKRGTKAALQITLDNLLLNPKSEPLSRALAISLALATVSGKNQRTLANELMVRFTHQTMTSKYGVRSAIETLELTLQLLLSYQPSVPTEAHSIYQITDAVQSIIGLQVEKLLTLAESSNDVTIIATLYGFLFRDLARRTVLSHTFA